MFLGSDNKMKWLRLAIATPVALAIILAGVFWFDAPVLIAMRQMDCRFWQILSYVFDEKIWTVVFAVALGTVYIKKSMQSKICFKNDKNRFSIKAILRDFWQKTKNSNVFLIFCSILCTAIIVEVLKVSFGRARPILFEALDFRGFYPPSFDWVFNSMPSGHTAISFAALVMMGMLAPSAKVFTWTLAVLIGVARVCVGAHWPSDVIFGAFIGMVVADFVKWAVVRLRAIK